MFTMQKAWTNRIIKQVETLVKPLLLSEELELVDITYRHERGRWILALFIDKEGGVTIEDCVAISREFGDLLDVKDIIPGPYSLEVSSPGLDRPLFTLVHFARFAGSQVRIKTRVKVGDRRKFIGLLMGVDGREVLLEQDGQQLRLPFDEIQSARLVPEF